MALPVACISGLLGCDPPLPEPPCVEGFIDCPETGRYGDSQGLEEYTFGTSGSSSSSANSIGGTSGNTSGGSAGSTTTGGTGGSSTTGGSSGGSGISSSSFFRDYTPSSSPSGSTTITPSSSSQSSSFFGSSFSSSSSSSSATFSWIGSSASSSSFSSSSSSGVSYSSSPRALQYTATVVNRGSSPLRTIVVTHGPIPSGLTFDAIASTTGCAQAGAVIQCSLDLQPGESKSILLTYAASNARSCSLLPDLLFVQSTDVSGTLATDVSSSVVCEVRAAGTMSGDSSSSSSQMSSVSSSVQSGAMGTTSNSTAVGAAPTEYGYKPVDMPRTGALSAYLLSDADAFTLTPHQATGNFSFAGMIVPLLLSIAFLVTVAIAKRVLSVSLAP